MTEHETVNMLLRLIGSSPVNTSESGHPDVANASATIDRVRKKLQKRGWWFNIDYNVPLHPQPSSGHILLDDTISTVVLPSVNLVKRGKKVFDNYNNTYVFSAPIVALRLVRTLEWDELPESFQIFASYVAGSEFVRDEIEDLEKKRDLEKDAGIALIDVKKEDLESGRYNMFNTGRIAQARAGVRPYGNRLTRFSGDPDV